MLNYRITENLAAGTGDSYDIAAAVKSWTDEVSEYPFHRLTWLVTMLTACLRGLRLQQPAALPLYPGRLEG